MPGSRDVQRPPPPEWGRRTGLFTYAGPEATQFTAPAGTVIIYDSRCALHSRSATLTVRTQLSDQKDQDGSVVDRTWHRSGMNRTDTNRIAVLNAVTPKWVVAMDDTRELYRLMLDRRDLLAELTEREREHVADFMSGSLSREAGRRMMREAARGLRGAQSQL